MDDFDLSPDRLNTQKPTPDIVDKSRVSKNTERLQTLFKQSPNKWRSQDVEVTPTNKIIVPNNIVPNNISSSSSPRINKLQQIREENQADDPILRLELVEQFQPYEPFGTVINQNGYSEDDQEQANNSEEYSNDTHKPWIQSRTMSQNNGIICQKNLMHSSSIVALSNKSVGLMIQHLKKEKDWKLENPGLGKIVMEQSQMIPSRELLSKGVQATTKRTT